jgi:DNA-binding CsgD family transcriptional regulator
MSLPTERQDVPRVLHGRTDECAHIDGMLADARAGRSGALVIRGEAGIGKSALIAHARARAAGMTVLAATGNEFDVDVSYAGLFDLLRPALDVIDELPEPQREALQSAFAMGSPSAGSRFGVAIGVLGHLSHLAGRAPVLITVDDGQWLDAASVEAIAFVARRVAAEGIVVLVAERSGVGAPSLYGGLPTLTLSGLDDAGVAALLAEVGRAVEDVGRYRRLTGGNPLVIHELARDGVPHTGDEAPVQATEAVRATFLAQVAPLAPRCRQALVYVAAAGQNDIPVLPAVLTSGGLAIADLDEAEAAGLLTVDAGRVTFRHPLLRSAVYHDAPPAVRRAVHVSFADALADLSAPAHAERRVAHLTMAGDLPDEPLAAEMERVGHAAAARSSYATAARMLERSALLSTDTDHRARRYLAAASCALPAGRLGDLGRLIEATFAWAGDDGVRMAASRLAYRGALWQGVPDPVHRFLAEGAQTPAGPAAADAAVMLAEAGLSALLRGDRETAGREVDRALALARGLPGPIRMPGQLVRATLHAIARENTQARVLLAQAAPFLASRPGEQWPLIAAMTLFVLDELVAAANSLDMIIAAMRRMGVLDLLPSPLMMAARVDFRRGDWAKARIAAHEAASLVSSLGGSTSETGGVLEPECAATLAMLEAAAGEATECRRHARICLAYGTAHRIAFMVGHGRRALGLLELGGGDFEAAAVQLRELDAMASAAGIHDTPMLPWLADLAEAELATGDRAAAGAALGRLVEHAAIVSTPAAEGLLLRVRALADGRPDPEALVASAALLHQAGVPFESARSRLSAGLVYRRRKQLAQARQQLISAFDVFDALGAVPWRDRAGAELRASGAAVPDQAPLAADLTPQELQVVRLAADGESNAQIAMTLFLSKKTVEFHLGKAFRKLGVNRRSQLAKIPGLTA